MKLKMVVSGIKIDGQEIGNAQMEMEMDREERVEIAKLAQDFVDKIPSFISNMAGAVSTVGDQLPVLAINVRDFKRTIETGDLEDRVTRQTLLKEADDVEYEREVARQNRSKSRMSAEA